MKLPDDVSPLMVEFGLTQTSLPMQFTKQKLVEVTVVRQVFIETHLGLPLLHCYYVSRNKLYFPKGRSRKLFERSLQDNKSFYTFGAHLKGEKEKLSELTRANALILSVGATFNHSQLLDIYHWFSEKTIFVRSSEIPEPLVFDFVLKHPDVVDQSKV